MANPLDQLQLEKIRQIEIQIQQKQREYDQIVGSLQRQNRELKGQFQSIQRLHMESKKQQSQLQSQKDHYRHQHDNYQNEINDLQQRISNINNDIMLLDSDIKVLKSESKLLEQQEQELTKKTELIKRLQLQILELEKQIKILKTSQVVKQETWQCQCQEEIQIPIYIPIAEKEKQQERLVYSIVQEQPITPRVFFIRIQNQVRSRINNYNYKYSCITMLSAMLSTMLLTVLLAVLLSLLSTLDLIISILAILILMKQQSESSSSAESLSYSSSSSSESSSHGRDRSRQRENKKQKKKLTTTQSKNQLIKQYQKLDHKKHKYLEKIGYTDQDNPYGDKSLAKSLIWKQKIDRKGLEQLSEDQLDEKLQDMLDEIQKLKDQRQKKQQEKIKLEEEKNRLTKERQAENYQQWIDNEDAFFEKVEKLRPLIRIQQQREVAFDKFVRICCIYKGQIGHQKHLETIMQKPTFFIKHQPYQDQKIILNESKKQLAIEIDSHTQFQDYWASIISIAQSEVEWNEQKSKDPNCVKFGIQTEFKQDIKSMFKDKTREELEEMEQQINFSLNNGTEFRLDFDYWEKILKKLKVIKAKTILKLYYDVFCRDLKYKSMRYNDKPILEDDLNTREIKINVERKIMHPDYDDYNENCSPYPEQVTDDFITDNEDLRLLELQRIEILKNLLNKAKLELEKAIQEKIRKALLDKKKSKPKPKIPEFQIPNNRKLEDMPEGLEVLAQQMFEHERSKPLEEDEVYFNEVPLPSYESGVTQKHKLKRPQYFNRVKMGFDWNQYNKTHYDVDNPPPKVVQGYKFNIFYPELIDKTQAPKYTLEPCENSDYCTIRFVAGPPYEDLAFQILCREWDYSDRMGFKSVFSRGILHLYFNFKKPRYRR